MSEVPLQGAFRKSTELHKFSPLIGTLLSLMHVPLSSELNSEQPVTARQILPQGHEPEHHAFSLNGQRQLAKARLPLGRRKTKSFLPGQGAFRKSTELHKFSPLIATMLSSLVQGEPLESVIEKAGRYTSPYDPAVGPCLGY